MAWNFGVQINSLTGFDGNDEGASEEGENHVVLASQWLTDAAREIIAILPDKLKQKCATVTPLSNSPTTMDLDGVGDILQVTRKSASDGYFIACRQVHPMHGDLTNDANSIYYATVTDPAYWITSRIGDSSDTADNDAGTLFVKPTPTSSQTANVYHVAYPSIDHADTVIANFPDEAEYLVVLRASMTAVEYKMSTEEDVDLYGPILKNLNTLYQQGVYSLKTGNFAAPSKDVRIATKGEKE